MSRVRFAPSHVTRERLAPNVIQPVVAITTRPVTPRLGRVFVQLGTSAKSRLQCRVLQVYSKLFFFWTDYMPGSIFFKGKGRRGWGLTSKSLPKGVSQRQT